MSRPDMGPTQPPLQWIPGLSPWDKRQEHGVYHSPPSSAEVNLNGAILLLPILPSRRVRDDFTFAIYPTTRPKRWRKTTRNFSQNCCNLAEFRNQAHLEYKFIPTSNGCVQNMSSPLRSDVAFVW